MTGTAPDNVSAVANLRLPKPVSLAVTDAWHSSTPVNVTSGLDTDSDGLFTDRAGRPRNSGRDPSYNSLDVFAHRRVAVRAISPEAGRKMVVDLGVQGINILGNKN